MIAANLELNILLTLLGSSSMTLASMPKRLRNFLLFLLPSHAGGSADHTLGEGVEVADGDNMPRPRRQGRRATVTNEGEEDIVM
jgi:hypothetical protein